MVAFEISRNMLTYLGLVKLKNIKVACIYTAQGTTHQLLLPLILYQIYAQCQDNEHSTTVNSYTQFMWITLWITCVIRRLTTVFITVLLHCL